ncbi:(2Fe-2S)-binding protein [Sinorhizobium alkalisoli]|uniref:Ferric siderophore reductase C-terminal domain-containing protein n=1 Tax=Sinorhizobium alkalisoli TaxID=1752398 RepID=A0A1E3V3G5_9HYPH|nr:(2Fe-2S)-binding protein [Sinorhizobium alkalisoli]MCG5483769.1 (2Fe-2S)-binding protein [Sinorhizobium meliloti]ODR88143.1 hypothetical protein A8M32_26675 [Sinorhizobium alkalisoli]
MRESGGFAASIDWLTAAFPEVGCSLEGPMGFAATAAFWAEGSTGMEACLAYQDRFASGMDDKIRAAHLIAFYCHPLGLAMGAVYLATGLVPRIAGLRFETYPRIDGGRSFEAGRFHFLLDAPSAAAGKGEEGEQQFHDGFVLHMKSIIALIKRRCGLSARAQWRLATDGLAGAFLEIGRLRGEQAVAIERALAIVKRAGSPLASRDLRYEEISVETPGGALCRTYRMRSGCCLYYRTEGGDFCDTCVLLRTETRRERLKAHLLETEGKSVGCEVVDCHPR